MSPIISDFFKKIAQQAGRRPSSRMPLFLFYFFIFHCVYFLLHLQYKKKLNHRMHTPPTPRPGAPPDQSGALITSSGAKISFYNLVRRCYTSFRPKRYTGKTKLGAGHTGATVLFRIWRSRITFIRV